MPDILSQTDETTDPERLAALLELPTQDNYLGLGTHVYGLLIGLLNFVAGKGIIVRDVHPTLGGVNEERVYSGLRAECMEYLNFSQRPELLAHAERRLPGRIVPIILGQEAWGKDEQDDAEEVRSKLEAACCLAGLDAYTDLFAEHYRAAGDVILFIAEQTAERMREQWTTEDARDRAAVEVPPFEWEWSLTPQPPPEPQPSSCPSLLLREAGSPPDVQPISLSKAAATTVEMASEESQATNLGGRTRREFNLDDLDACADRLLEDKLDDERTTAAANRTSPPKESDISVTAKEVLDTYNGDMGYADSQWDDVDRSTVYRRCRDERRSTPWSRRLQVSKPSNE